MKGPELDPVRHQPESPIGHTGEVVRISIRLDYEPDNGSLTWSLIAWEHPGRHLVENLIWQTYDEYHAGMAPLDLLASIYSALEQVPNPFP